MKGLLSYVALTVIGIVIMYMVLMVIPQFLFVFIALSVISILTTEKGYNRIIESTRNSALDRSVIGYIGYSVTTKTIIVLVVLATWASMYIMVGYSDTYTLISMSESFFNKLLGFYLLLAAVAPIKIHLSSRDAREKIKMKR